LHTTEQTHQRPPKIYPYKTQNSPVLQIAKLCEHGLTDTFGERIAAKLEMVELNKGRQQIVGNRPCQYAHKLQHIHARALKTTYHAC
jgi:hypothetical protein